MEFRKNIMMFFKCILKSMANACFLICNVKRVKMYFLSEKTNNKLMSNEILISVT